MSKINSVEKSCSEVMTIRYTPKSKPSLNGEGCTVILCI